MQVLVRGEVDLDILVGDGEIELEFYLQGVTRGY